MFPQNDIFKDNENIDVQMTSLFFQGGEGITVRCADGNLLLLLFLSLEIQAMMTIIVRVQRFQSSLSANF